MFASVLLDECRKAGIDFFTGVPDSFLKGLCDELYDRFGADGPSHIVAHNEGGALGLCAGHYLATGHPALCYMQNSGLGNTVNPLTSLTDPAVYAIPCLLVIGWRGEPGLKDEPQHVKQGAVTLSQLDLLGIPHATLSPDTSDDDFRVLFGVLLAALCEGKVAALVVRKGALVSDRHPAYGNNAVLTREEAADLILRAASPSDCFVSTTGKLSREVFELREKHGEDHRRDFLTVGSMGHASMIALGVAEAKPDRRVWCLDGDGAVLMHLGSLAVIGRRSPKNLIHVVINNGAHETVGGMPVCSGALNIEALAKAAGYRHVLRADSAATLQQAAESLASLQGPVLLEVRCACGARKDLGRPTTTPVQNRDAFMSFLNA